MYIGVVLLVFPLANARHVEMLKQYKNTKDISLKKKRFNVQTSYMLLQH